MPSENQHSRTNKPNSCPPVCADKQVGDQAVEWFSRLQIGELTPAESAAFEFWKSQSPEHEQVLREVEALWLDADFNQALHIVAGRKRTTDSATETPLDRHRLMFPSAAISLALAATLLIAAIGWNPLLWWRSDLYTGKGEIRSFTLADGSTITLNAQTAVAVAYQPDQRRIRLLRGEAYFDVQANAARPFVVDSGLTQTKVLGTRFLVRKSENQDRIAVEKGRVQVENATRHSQVVLEPGQTVVNAASGLHDIVADDGRQSAWRSGRLIFQDASLAEIIAELRRYSPGFLIMGDRSLEQLHIDARIDITQPAAALQTLEQTLPIKLVQVSRWVTLIIKCDF